jgi:hypothetical protein
MLPAQRGEMTMKFSDPNLQAVYEQFKANPPTKSYSGAASSAYFLGLSGQPNHRIAKDSIAYAAFCAGRDNRVVQECSICRSRHGREIQHACE